MKITHLTPADYTTSSWSGGATTQLFIHPAQGDYPSRNFMARISSATVELEQSDFTPLPGVERFITPLKGGFTLSHPDGRQVEMAPLDRPYRFEGGEATHCVGKATDFNLMLKGARGDMRVVRGGCPLDAPICVLFFPQGGEAEVGGSRHSMAPGHTLVITQPEGEAAFGLAIVCRIY